ncbi:hypothetical protein V2A60_003005 [Cordyceps javanica]|uniref:RING-type E3 ubiquitin transferase n=1 Tax=Cordyceps javanica TaxID=43265 RepID=A0A545V4G3_9HYPO|nr:RING finger domain-containing protein [Cordyceps javanica]
MASEVHPARRLDATDREVVYCHACAYEWFRDEYGLECPSCESDITEVVSLENDPRPGREDDSDDSDDSDIDPSHSPEFHRNLHEDEDDSDPEVADIDEHLDPNGFGYDHSTQVGEDANHYDARPEPSVERFLGIVSSIGIPFAAGDGNGNLMDRLREASQNGGGRVEWSNATSQGSVTFYSSNRSALGADEPIGFGPFSTMFTSAFRDFGVQLTGEALQAAAEQGGSGGLNLAGNLGDLLGLINNGVHGDAVYSQEALDRIVSTLMEANSQSTAAPPASEQGLASLPRKTIDEDLKSEDGNTECSICIDGMKVGEVVVSLPCNHSFHEECVVAWLKAHNTCPVCRAPMEQNERDRNTAESRQQEYNNQNNIQNEYRRERQGVPTPTVVAGDERGVQTGPAEPARLPGLTPTPPRAGSSRPPNQSQTRLNEAMRLLSSQHGERDRSRGSSTGFSYDTSRLQRRSSMSPTSPRAPAGGEARSMRERSPSQSTRRTDSAEESSSRTQTGMGWFRG